VKRALKPGPFMPFKNTMSVKFNTLKLYEWLEDAMFAQTTFFRVRKTLFAKLGKCVSKDGEEEVSTADFQTLKNFLLSRNQDISDAKTLAFDTLIADMYERLGVQASSKEEKKAAAPASV